MEDNSDSGFADEILICGNETEFSSDGISSLVITNGVKIDTPGSTTERPATNPMAHFIDVDQEIIGKQEIALYSDNDDEDDEDYDEDEDGMKMIVLAHQTIHWKLGSKNSPHIMLTLNYFLKRTT